MDIQQAIDTFLGENVILQKKIDANNVAISILRNTFQAEFASRDQAIKEAQDAQSKIGDLTSRAETAEKAASDAQIIIEEKTNDVVSLNDQLNQMDKMIDDANEMVANLKAENESLKQAQSTPPSEVPPSDLPIEPIL